MSAVEGPSLGEVSSPSMAIESARKVCARLHQGYRDHRLYPQGHPTIVNTMEIVASTVDSHLEAHGPLALGVTEHSLLFEAEEVYSHAESRDNLAFLMFRDGIRSVTLAPGIEPGELETLVACLACADQMVDTDQDLSTVLWEKDLVHVQLDVVDPFLEGEGFAEEAFEDLRDTVMRRLNELSSVDKAEAEAASASTGDQAESGAGATGEEQGELTQDDVALTDEETARGEWLASHPTDPLEEFVVVLMEIVGCPAELPGGQDAVLKSVSLVLAHYLEDLDWDRLGTVLRHLGGLEAAGILPLGTVEKVFSDAATAEHLSKMITDASLTSPQALQDVERFLAQVRTSIYPALLETLATSEDKTVRRTVLGLLHMEGGTPVEYLYPLMKDSRWYVVRNAVQLATASNDADLLTNLEPLLRHGDERVRREVIRSLGALNEPRCLPLLTRAIQDTDSAVRILSVRVLTRMGAHGQFPAVKVQVESRDFEDRSAEEVEAFLVAYGTLGGEATVDTLTKMWKRRMFGTRPMPVRTGAVLALGAVGGAAADRALSEALKCGEPQLQRAAARAAGEAQARMKGADS